MVDRQEIKVGAGLHYLVEVEHYDALVAVVNRAALIPGLYLFPHNDAALQDSMEGLTVALAELLKASL